MNHDDKATSDSNPPASSNFHTAMAHLYRGEVNRLTVWHVRLDTTTNWAMLLTTGMTTFALGSERTPHYVLLLGLAIIAMCVSIEARRYQHVHHSAHRLRLLESGYFKGLLEGRTEAAWRDQLSQDLAQPRGTLSWLQAARIRLRHNYLMLVYFITAVWITKLYIHPACPGSLHEFYERLAVGSLIPSWFVAVSAAFFVLGATGLAFRFRDGKDVI